jgi:hypothetical protein
MRFSNVTTVLDQRWYYSGWLGRKWTIRIRRLAYLGSRGRLANEPIHQDAEGGASRMSTRMLQLVDGQTTPVCDVKTAQAHGKHFRLTDRSLVCLWYVLCSHH